MNLIERYIFRRAGIAALATLGSLAGVVWIIQALKEIDVFTTKGQTIFAYLAITTLIIPMLLLAVIPIALLLASVYTVNTLNSNSELVVINASGASNWVLTKPLILLALICSLFTGGVGHFVSPWSLMSLKVFATQMRADLVSVLIREGQFTTVEDGLVFYVARREAGGVLSGILISDEREAGKSVIFNASKGFVSRRGDDAYLLLRDGEIQQRTTDNGNITVIKYDSYVFDLSSFAKKSDIGDVRPKERSTLELFNPAPDDPYYKQFPGLYRAQIHERFSEMLWPFTYVIVMLAFAGQARSSRQGYGSAIGAAMITVTVLRGAGFSAVGALKGDDGSLWLVYGLPIAGMIVGMWFLIANQPVSLPLGMQRRLDANGEAMRHRFEQLAARYADWRRKFSGMRA